MKIRNISFIVKLVPLPVGANDVDAFIPELWAQSGLVMLFEHMIAANLVNRDFEPILSKYGDVVNTRRPAKMVARRKHRDSSIILNDAVATNIPVPLDQHIYNSFIVHDSDATKSMVELEKEYILPATMGLASMVDTAINNQAYFFRANSGGKLGTPATVASLLALDSAANTALAPMSGRNLLVSPAAKADLLLIDQFTNVNQSGSTRGLYDASLGRKYGFDFYMTQNVPHTTAVLQTLVTGAINNGNIAAGSTTLTVDGFTGDAVPVGSYVTIAGDMQIQRVTAKTLTSSNTTEIVISPGLKYAVVDGAVITKIKPALVNLTAGYASGWAEPIAYDGLTSGDVIQVGSMVSFGTSATVAEYTVVSVVNAGTGTGTILLDRPLSAAIVNDATINIGPTGNVNFYFNRDALTLAIRPLAAPKGGGTNAFTAYSKELGVSIRVCFTYDPYLQATVCTFDFLAGIKVLDVNLGGVLYN